MGSGADRTPDGRSRLSPREREVIEMATLGLTNGEIAAQLRITVHAVKFHLAAVYRKLGVGNRTEAAVAYMSNRRPMETIDDNARGG